MELYAQLPAPFLFNGLKHHRQIILDFIKNTKDRKVSMEDITDELKKVGNSMIDLYYGNLSPEMLTNEFMVKLKKERHFLRREYVAHINKAPKKYKNMFISDGSEWTLLVGRDALSYLHIHPSRGSKFTQRVHAIACKTAILLRILFDAEMVDADLLSLANKVRRDFLHTSPVKSELGTRRLKNVLDLL